VGEHEEYVVDPDLEYRERGPVQLNTVHRQLMYRILCGQKPHLAAKDLGLSPGGVGVIVRSPLFKAELRRMELQMEEKIVNVNERFRNAGPSAFNTIVGLMKTSENERVKLDAAKEVINYTKEEMARKGEEKRDHGRTVSLAWERRKRMIRANGAVEETVETIERVEQVASAHAPQVNADGNDYDSTLSISDDPDEFVLDSQLGSEDARMLQAIALEDEETNSHNGEAAKLFQELMGMTKVATAAPVVGSPANGSNGNGNAKNVFKDALREVTEG
jgi:hypothetical protein